MGRWSPAMAGHWRGGGVGIAVEKAWHGGGLEGWTGRRLTGGGECFLGGRGDAPPAEGGGGLLFGRLRGVEIEYEPHALDFVSNGCKID